MIRRSAAWIYLVFTYTIPVNYRQMQFLQYILNYFTINQSKSQAERQRKSA